MRRSLRLKCFWWLVNFLCGHSIFRADWRLKVEFEIHHIVRQPGRVRVKLEQNSFFARPHQIAAFSKHVRISFSVGSQVSSLRQTVFWKKNCRILWENQFCNSDLVKSKTISSYQSSHRIFRHFHSILSHSTRVFFLRHFRSSVFLLENTSEEPVYASQIKLTMVNLFSIK